MKQIDFLVVGHVSNDIVAAGVDVGGTAIFSGRTAYELGCQTAVLTSAGDSFDFDKALPGIDVHCVPSKATTSFENVYTTHGREQTLHALAERLTPADVPEEWRHPSIVHLAPIADEVDIGLMNVFSNSLVGLTPQGWLRRWNEKGRVFACEWPAAEAILPLAAAVILSVDDLLNDAMLDQYRQWASLVVLTQAEAGCTVFFGDEVRQIAAPRVTQREPTGAGDVFAAAFLTRMHQTAGNPWESARFANEIAAQSVTQSGVAAKMAQIRAFHTQSHEVI